jgi:hypothetical protein
MPFAEKENGSVIVEKPLPRLRLWQIARNCPDAEGYFDALMVAHGHEPLAGECIVGGGFPERFLCELGKAPHDECREARVQKVQAALERWGGTAPIGSGEADG